MTHNEGSPGTQEDSPRKRRPSGDEGAACTKRIIGEVKRRRAGLDWSAERLAEEMAAAGVPWTRDVVVNLENGRRKTLAVHELLALAWVLDVASPVDLIAPPGTSPDAEPFPVTPEATAGVDQVRAWFGGKPLRSWTQQLGETLAGFREIFDRAVAKGEFTAEQAEQLMATSQKAFRGWVQPGPQGEGPGDGED